uniref:Uncharacterized protein n=1 Tax=Romanomermis culicivorax TaxID=13658 RepID=A0A915L3S1_ROMCU
MIVRTVASCIKLRNHDQPNFLVNSQTGTSTESSKKCEIFKICSYLREPNRDPDKKLQEMKLEKENIYETRKEKKKDNYAHFGTETAFAIVAGDKTASAEMIQCRTGWRPNDGAENGRRNVPFRTLHDLHISLSLEKSVQAVKLRNIIDFRIRCCSTLFVLLIANTIIYPRRRNHSVMPLTGRALRAHLRGSASLRPKPKQA